MKIMIFGATGMLGHKLVEILSEEHQIFAISRYQIKYQNKNIRNHIVKDITNRKEIENIIQQVNPDYIINAVGIVKTNSQMKNENLVVKINSEFPHALENICESENIKLIHISTDCVFSGKKGMYQESDIPDPVDMYGESKLKGEISNSNNCLTIRTSMIGLEENNQRGLVEWFISQKNGQIKGYKNAIFSGLTTQYLSKIIKNIIENHQSLYGLYHVSVEKISKLDLLSKLNQVFNTNITITPVEEPKIDRSLDSSKFWNTIGGLPPTWSEMIDGLKNEYEGRKNVH